MREDSGRERMRAADADRQQVADQLRAALDEGRLDLAEYDERVQSAYAARTYADLDRLLADLPNAAPLVPAPPTPPPAPVATAGDRATKAWLGHVWGSWARALAVLTVIWLVGSVLSGGPVAYWPVWILGPWGVVLLLRTGAGLAKGEPRRHALAEEHRRRLREHRRERRQLECRAIARGDLPPNPTKEQRKAFIAEAMARGDLPPKPRRPE